MTRWIVAGIVLQVLLIVAGHFLPGLRSSWGPCGMMIALVVGCLIAHTGGHRLSVVLLAGALAGGVGAFLGIGLALILGDVPPSLLLLGTISSVVAGIVGSVGVALLTHQFATR